MLKVSFVFPMPIILTGLLSLALAACGDDDGGGTPNPDAAPVATPDAAPTADAAPNPADAQPADGGTDTQINAAFVGAGNHISLVRDPATDTIYAMGENIRAQLGLGFIDEDVHPEHEYPVPQLVEGLADVEIAALYSGQAHAGVIDKNGQVYLWGQNISGELGLGAAVDDPTVADPGCARLPDSSFYNDKPNNQVCTPTRNPGLSDVVELALANGFSLARTKDGKVFSFGNNSNGQLGHGNEERAYVPVQIAVLADNVVVDLAAGIGHSLAVTDDGAVYAWGGNRDGQLGQGNNDENEILTPVRVTGLDDKVVIAVGAGNFHSFAITADGELYAWGENDFGQLGLGTIETTEPTPVQVTLPEGVVPVAVVGGSRHSYLLSADGDIYTWGRVGLGQLGNGAVEADDAEFVTTPAKLQALDALDIVELVAGPNHGLVRTADGAFYGWGSNGQGRLAQGTSFDFESIYALPVRLDLSRAVVDIPANSAVGLTFIDGDLDADQLSGEITIQRAGNEDDVDGYQLYWGSTATTKLDGQDAIVRLPKSGADVVHTFAADTAIPTGASHFLVYTQNRFGEMGFGVSIRIIDATL